MTGRLEIDGHGRDELAQAGVAARVGLVFQDPGSQLVMERVEDDVAFGLENRAWPRTRCVPASPRRSRPSGLAGLDRQRSRRLSGGQQQRLALAGALAPRPGLLVLDEPTANLDRGGRRRLLATLGRRIRDARSATVVLIEHQVDRAWPLADLVLALDGDGSPDRRRGPPDAVLDVGATRCATAGIWLPRAPRAASGAVSTMVRPSAIGDVLVRPPTASGSATTGRPRRARPVARRGRGRAHRARRRRTAAASPRSGGCSSASSDPTTGSSSLAAPDPARLPAAALARHAGYVFQEPERQFLAQRVGDEVRLGLTADELARVDDLMARLGLPLDRFAERSPIGCRAASSVGCRSPASWSAGRRCSSSTSRRSGRIAYGTRACSASSPTISTGRLPHRGDPRRAVRAGCRAPGHRSWTPAGSCATRPPHDRARLEVGDAQLDSPLGRTSPLVKLAIAFVWLLGLALTLHPMPPLLLAGVALAAGLALRAHPARAASAGSLAPLWIAALAIGVVEHAVRRRERRPLAATTRREPRAAPDHDRGRSSTGAGARCSGSRPSPASVRCSP